jgi:cbb3-type cytochrome oxidase subunit 3
MCVAYVLLAFGVAFFAGMSILIIVRAHQQKKKAHHKSALVSPLIGDACNSN